MVSPEQDCQAVGPVGSGGPRRRLASLADPAQRTMRCGSSTKVPAKHVQVPQNLTA